jgi:hypothetical protein
MDPWGTIFMQQQQQLIAVQQQAAYYGQQTARLQDECARLHARATAMEEQRDEINAQQERRFQASQEQHTRELEKAEAAADTRCLEIRATLDADQELFMSHHNDALAAFKTRTHDAVEELSRTKSDVDVLLARVAELEATRTQHAADLEATRTQHTAELEATRTQHAAELEVTRTQQATGATFRIYELEQQQVSKAKAAREQADSEAVLRIAKIEANHTAEITTAASRIHKLEQQVSTLQTRLKEKNAEQFNKQSASTSTDLVRELTQQLKLANERIASEATAHTHQLRTCESKLRQKSEKLDKMTQEVVALKSAAQAHKENKSVVLHAAKTVQRIESEFAAQNAALLEAQRRFVISAHAWSRLRLDYEERLKNATAADVKNTDGDVTDTDSEGEEEGEEEEVKHGDQQQQQQSQKETTTKGSSKLSLYKRFGLERVFYESIVHAISRTTFDFYNNLLGCTFLQGNITVTNKVKEILDTMKQLDATLPCV